MLNVHSVRMSRSWIIKKLNFEPPKVGRLERIWTLVSRRTWNNIWVWKHLKTVPVLGVLSHKEEEGLTTILSLWIKILILKRLINQQFFMRNLMIRRKVEKFRVQNGCNMKRKKVQSSTWAVELCEKFSILAYSSCMRSLKFIVWGMFLHVQNSKIFLLLYV